MDVPPKTINLFWFISNVKNQRDYDHWWLDLMQFDLDHVTRFEVSGPVIACDRDGHVILNEEGCSVSWNFRCRRPKFVPQDSQYADDFLGEIETIIAFCSGKVIFEPVGRMGNDGKTCSKTWISLINPTGIQETARWWTPYRCDNDPTCIPDVHFEDAQYQFDEEDVRNKIQSFFMKAMIYGQPADFEKLNNLIGGLLKNIRFDRSPYNFIITVTVELINGMNYQFQFDENLILNQRI